MRGNAKNLKPMLTPTVERALEAVELAEAGALVLWFARQYRIMLDVLEDVYDKVKTPRDVAIALDGAPEPPRPDVSEKANAYFTILRGEAQDLVESNITGKLADRERKRKKSEERKRVSVLSAEKPESAESAEKPESAESAEKPESAESAESAESFSPLESSLSESVKSVSQSTRGRARTTHAFGSEDYRRAGEAAGYGSEELRRFVAVNERGVLSPAEAVQRWNERRTPTERAGGASAVEAQRQAQTGAAARAQRAQEEERERQRKADSVARMLAIAEERGVRSVREIDAIGEELDAFCGDVWAAKSAWLEAHPGGGDTLSPRIAVDNLSTGDGGGTP